MAYQLRDNGHQWDLFTVGSVIKTFQLLFTLYVIRTLNADALTSQKITHNQDFLHIFSPSSILHITLYLVLTNGVFAICYPDQA